MYWINLPPTFYPVWNQQRRSAWKTYLVKQPTKGGNPDLTFEDKLKVRQIGATLAAKLCKYYQYHNLPGPSVVEKWREESSSPNEFAEVNNAWKNHYA